MAGLLDFLQTPTGIGLLSAVASGAAGARRGTPWNNVGRGMVGGLMGYNTAQDQIKQDQENAFNQQYRKLQMDDMQSRMEAAKRAQAESEAKNAMFGNIAKQFVKTTDYQADNPFNENLGTLKNEAGFDFAGYQQALPAELAKAGYVQDALSMMPKPSAPMKVSSGDRLIDPATGKELYAAPEKVDYNKPFLPDGRPNPAYQSYELRRTAAGQTQVNNFPAPVPVQMPDGTVKMVQFGNKGAIRETPYFPPPSDKPLTGEENKAAGYLGRMQSAEQVIGQLTGKGESTVGTNVAKTIPLIGDYAERNAMTPQQQEYKQAADDWIRAKLRNESGAVIADEEMKREYQTYFPQPGDDESTIKQKAAARKQAEQQMQQTAGRAKAVVDERTAYSLKGQGTFKDPMIIKDDNEWSTVPKGAYYKSPDGKIRIKK